MPVTTQTFAARVATVRSRVALRAVRSGQNPARTQTGPGHIRGQRRWPLRSRDFSHRFDNRRRRNNGRYCHWRSWLDAQGPILQPMDVRRERRQLPFQQLLPQLEFAQFTPV